MGDFTIRGIRFGDGIPKIFVPITERRAEDILQKAKDVLAEAEELEKKYPDSKAARLTGLELRADFFDQVTEREALLELLAGLRRILGDRLLLFTYRSEEEGGELRHDRAQAMIPDIHTRVCESKKADLLDIELGSGNYRVARTAVGAHSAKMGVVLSYHNFQETIHTERAQQMLRDMETLGGDILKLAVMPENELDVERMNDLCLAAAGRGEPEEALSKPVVVISMGKIGQESRINGFTTGSCITFASAGKASAPGQYTMEEIFGIFAEQEEKHSRK